MKTKKSERFFQKPKKADNDNENGNENENENGNDNGNDNEKSLYAGDGVVKEAEHIGEFEGEDLQTGTVCDVDPIPVSDVPISSVPLSEFASGLVSDVDSISVSDAISDRTSGLLSEREKDGLVKKGLPISYVLEREHRATQYAQSHGEQVESVLLRWWERDGDSPKYVASKNSRNIPRQPTSVATSDPTVTVGTSFDVNDFFEVAIRASERKWREKGQ